MKTDPEKTKAKEQVHDRTMADLVVPRSENTVGADSLTANPLPPSNLTPDEQKELDAQRQKPFTLTEANPTGKVVDEGGKEKAKPTDEKQTQPENTERTIPKGRMIAGSVGRGGENHPDDVKVVIDKLSSLKIITPEEVAEITQNPELIGDLVERYQGKVFKTVSDGKISAGGETETRLIKGLTSVPQPKAKPLPKLNEASNATQAGVLAGMRKDLLTPMRPPVNKMETEFTPAFPGQKLGKTFEKTEGIGADIWRHQIAGATGDRAKYIDNQAGETSCKIVCDKMAYRTLYPTLGNNFTQSSAKKYIETLPVEERFDIMGTSEGNFLPLVSEDKSDVKDIDPSNQKVTQSKFDLKDSAETAVGYASEYLKAGKPIVAGIDHSLNRSLSSSQKSTQKGYGYNEGTTDHFLLLVSQGTDEKGRRYFQFFDPGTSHKSKGTAEANRLVETSPGIFSCTCPYDDKRTYTLSMIVPYSRDKNREGFAEIFKQNKDEKAKLIADSQANSGAFEFRKP